MTQGLTYRKLPPEEWGRLRPLFDFLDAFLPDSLAAQAAVVENSVKSIVGFQLCQVIMHAEPHWEAPEYRGRIDSIRLHNLAVPEEATKKSLCAPGLFLVATNENVERLAELAGYTRLPGTVWVKDLRKKEAAA
jgi:hypothetical protein